MKKQAFTVLLFLGFGVVHAQYLENFTGQSGKGLVDAICPPTATGINDCGCICGSTSVTDDISQCTVIPPDLSGVNWTITSNDFTGFDHSSPDDFGVVILSGNEVFQANDPDNETCWNSPVLNIAGAGAVTISILAGEVNGSEADEYIRAEYSLNGGAFIPFGNASGDFNSATFTVSGLTGTTLAIRVCVDQNGGSQIIWFDNVSVPQTGVFVNCNQPSLSTSVTHVVCAPNSGAINLSVSGGAGGYTYAWSNGPTTQDINGLAPGTYTVTVTDAASCPNSISATVLNSPIVQSAVTYPAYCNESNGAIDLSVSGGNPGYTYLWTGGATTQDRSGLAAGSYSVSVTDSGGCTSIQSYTVAASNGTGPYLETFGTPNKGYRTGFVDDLLGLNWTLSPWSSGRETEDYFNTTAAGKLESIDTDLEICWTSPEINITGAGPLAFSVDLGWTGIDAEDYVKVQYSVNGGAFTQVANQVGGGANTIQYASGATFAASATVTVPGISGTSLQIRVCVNSSGNDDVITIDNVSVPDAVSLCFAPPNDLCADAFSIGCGGSLTGSIDGATNTGAPSGCAGGGTPQAGIWFTFTGTGQVITLSTAGSTFNTQLNVYTGTCGALTCVAGDDDSGPGNTSQVTFCSSNGVTYYIYLDADTATPIGDYTLAATCANSASPTISCPGTQTRDLNASCQYSVQNFTGLATANDDCPGLNVTQSPSVGTTLTGPGNNTVTLTATDANNNTANCTFTLTLEDVTPPAVDCPTSFSDAVVDANCENALADYAALLLANNDVIDACDATPTVTQTPLPGTISGPGPVLVSITAVDDDNNSNTSCSFTINVVDLMPPTASNLDPLNVVCPQEIPDPDPDLVTDEDDNCSTLIVVTFLNDLDNGGAGSVSDPKIITRTYQLEDEAGNTGTATQIITLADNEAPGISCPGNIEVDNDSGLCGAVVDFSATATDNCGDDPSISYSQNPGTLFSVGTNTVTATADDGRGNTANCSFTVTVNDTEAPDALCQDITVQLNAAGIGTTTAAAVNNGSTDNCDIDELSLNQTTFDCDDVATGVEVTLTVTDVNNLVSTCTANVTVADNVDPIAVCQNVTVQLDGNGNGATTAAAVNNGSSDVCGIGSLELDQTSFNCSDIGPNTVTLTVTDSNNNTASCTATVTVEDNAPPTAICKIFTLNLTSDGVTPLLPADVDDSSFTACGSFSLSVSPNAFSCNDIGPNTVTLTVTDQSNLQTNTCTTTVTVADPQNYCCAPPEAVCQHITVQLNAGGTASILPEDIDDGSTFDCGLLSMDLDISSFDCFDVGANTVTLTVTDLNNTADQCTATVTVEDNVDPVAVCQNVTVQLNAAGMGSTTAVAVNNGSSDACGILSLSLNETDFDCSEVGPNTVTLTVTDENGNSSTCTATVTVEDNVDPVAVCQNVTVQLNAAGSGATTATAVNNGSSDACGILSLSLNETDFDCSEVGPNTVTLTVTDVNGNSSTCTATVTVEDNVDPVAVCQNVTVQLNSAGSGSTTAAAVNNGSSDACGILSLSLNETDFDCSEVGPNTVTLTVTDVNGNSSTCTATVTVEDQVDPVAVCQSVTVQLNDEGQGEITATQVNNGSSDACGILSLGLNQTKFDCIHVGTVNVTLTVTDMNGNSATCSATVTVEDPVAPEAICQDVTVQLDAEGNGSTTAAAVDNGSNDACGIESLSLNTSAFDCSDVGENTVTLTVTDVNENTSTCTATVTVEDHIDPVALCQDVTVQLDAEGNGSTTAAAVDNGSNDACGIESLSLNTSAFDCSDLGENTVTLTVTDVNENTSTCTATVTVEDNIDPEIDCSNLSVTFNGEDVIAIDPENLVSATDNCGIESYEADLPSIDCEDLGAVIPVSVTVTDPSGNSASCTANVTVEGLPCGWMQMPNGIGCTNGNSADYDLPSGTFSLTASGCYTPSATADESGFIKYALCGDGSITAHIAGLTLPGFAGIVMRETDAPGAKKVALVYQGASTLQRYARYTTNGASFPSYIPTPGSRWLRIVRTGNVFRGYHSVNGITWIYSFAVTVPMNSCIQVGLIASGTNANSVVTATFDNVVITPPYSSGTRAAIQPEITVDQTPGVEIWPNPADGQATLNLDPTWGKTVQVEIRDGLGQLTRRLQADALNEGYLDLDLSDQAPGVYFIRVQNPDGRTATLRIVIARP